MSAGTYGDAFQERIKWLKNLRLLGRAEHLNIQYSNATVASYVVDRAVICVDSDYVEFVLES